jgi:hypothetical protein
MRGPAQRTRRAASDFSGVVEPEVKGSEKAWARLDPAAMADLAQHSAAHIPRRRGGPPIARSAASTRAFTTPL